MEVMRKMMTLIAMVQKERQRKEVMLMKREHPRKSISVETHCMKNKPIDEGYKFFALTTTN
eukprot:11974142-Ditylum_brightwellii.AAC.1